MTVETGGPYVSFAVLCEKVLREVDGVFSLIRIIDRIMVSPGPGAPEQMPTIPIALPCAIGFKAGVARGSFTLKLTLATPEGKEDVLGTFPLLFEGEDRGVNVNINLNFQISVQGLYWIGVYVEDNLLTRIPLRILWQRVGGGTLQQ